MQDYLILMCSDSMTQHRNFLIRFHLKFPDKCMIMDYLLVRKNQRYLNIFRNSMCRNTRDSQKFLSINDSQKFRSFQDSQRFHSTPDSRISLSTQDSKTFHNIHVNQKFLNILVNMNNHNKAVKLTLQDCFVLMKIVHPSLKMWDLLRVQSPLTKDLHNQQIISLYHHKSINVQLILPNQDTRNNLKNSAVNKNK